MAAVYTHRVRYHETDAQGFLFNARYLEVADVAMTEWLRSLGFTYDALVADGLDVSVVTATIHFKSPARFDDVLDADVRCTRVGRSSFALAVQISRAGDAVATVDLVYVNVDTATATSRPLPEFFTRALVDPRDGPRP